MVIEMIDVVIFVLLLAFFVADLIWLVSVEKRLEKLEERIFTNGDDKNGGI